MNQLLGRKDTESHFSSKSIKIFCFSWSFGFGFELFTCFNLLLITSILISHRKSESLRTKRNKLTHKCVFVHKGKTPADQAEGDSELATYLSTQQHTSSVNREDLETAVWGAHTHRHTLTLSLWTLVEEKNPWAKNVLKKRTESGLDSSVSTGGDKSDKPEERWTASAHSSTGVEILMVIYLFVFIYSYSIYWLCWLIDWLIDCRTINGSGCKCTLSSRHKSRVHMFRRVNSWKHVSHLVRD